MKIFSKHWLATAAVVAASIASIPAQASTFASAILDINNFRLLHSSAVAYSTTDFTVLTGTNDAHATASLNGIFANGAASFGILSGIQTDVAHQCIGAPCPARPENNFLAFPSPPPVPGTFGYADQDLTGAAITIGATPAGAHARTRADASTALNAIASGNSSVGTSTTFSFTLGAADTMTISFDGTPDSQTFVSAGSGPTANANARLSWSINIIDLATNLSIFSYSPPELNGLSAVSRTDGMPGLTTYDPGTAAFLAVTPLLLAGTTYQITVEHNTLANALQQELPEPGTMAVLAIGLLAMSLGMRRRHS